MPSAVQSQARANLNADQKEALDEFESRCRASGLLDQPSGLKANELAYGINDGVTLLRFLRARSFDVQRAFELFCNADHARRVSHFNEVYARLDHDLYHETTKLYPHWTGRRDRRGQPVSFFDIAKVNTASINAHKESSRSIELLASALPSTSACATETLRVCAVHDCLTRFVFPLCSAATDRPQPHVSISKQVIIADLSDLSFKRIWELKGFIQGFNTLLANNYPEILDSVLMIGCSSLFSTLWRWVKGWLDPVTAAKLQVVPPGEVLSTLESLMDIDCVPRRYGGNLDVEPGTSPQLDKGLSEALSLETGAPALPCAPLLWRKEDGKTLAVVVGRKQGQTMDMVVGTLR